MNTNELTLGDTFAYRLENGAYSILRTTKLIESAYKMEQEEYGQGAVIISQTSFYFDELPTIDEIDFEDKNYNDALNYSFNRKPKNALFTLGASFWYNGELPVELIYLGNKTALEREETKSALSKMEFDRLLDDAHKIYELNQQRFKERK
jgi:hypothetical protein